MYKNNTIGIVIPAYNEENLILKTLEGIPEYVDKIYVIDDCSTDRTSELVKTVEDARVVLIQHQKNTGVGGAVVSGFKRAQQDSIEIVSIMAGDNQMDPRYLPKLLEPIVNGEAEFTKGNRLKRNYWKGMSKFRLFGNKILSIINKLVSGYWHINDSQNGYVAIAMKSLERINLDTLYVGYAFENDIMVKANVAEISMKSVLIPARYADEVSKIVYRKFIRRTSFHLFKSYFWRIWHKYLKRASLVGFLMFMSLLCIISGGVWGAVTKFEELLVLTMPAFSTFFIVLGVVIDGINGMVLSVPSKKEIDYKLQKEREKIPTKGYNYPVSPQVFFK